MKKQNNKHNFTWIKCFTLIIAIIVVLLLAVNLVQLFQLNKWKDKIEKIECSTITSEIDMQNSSNASIDLSHFYDALDEKADAAINKVVAVVGILTTVITLFGGLIVFKAPNDVEEKLNKIENEFEEKFKKIEEELEKSNANIEQSNTKSTILDVHSISDKKEQITILTKYIRTYKGKEQYLGEIYFERGSLYDETNQYSEAETDYMYAKKLGFDEDQCFNALGILYNNRLLKEKNPNERQKLFKKAEFYYENAKNMTTDLEYKSNVLCNMACLYGDDKDYNKAFELFDEAIKINDNNYNAHLNKAITLESMGEEKYKKALKEYTKCINKNSEHTLAHKYRIDLAMKILEKDSSDLEAINCCMEDHEFLSKESQYLNIMEQRYSRITQKHILDTAIKEIDKKIAELENEERILRLEDKEDDENKE